MLGLRGGGRKLFINSMGTFSSQPSLEKKVELFRVSRREE